MMLREKQIEEMAEAIFQNCNCGLFFSEAEKIARFVIEEQGYRKQSDGKWEKFEGERFICSNCAKVFELGSTATIYDVKRMWKYCPNCGAKMKGGTE